MRLIAGLWLAVLLATPAAAADSLPGRIALIGVDHQVHLLDPNGGDPQPLTGGADPGRMAFRFVLAGAVQDDTPPPGSLRFSNPTWSPDGKALLVHGARTAGEGVSGTAGIYRLDPERPGVITPVLEDSRRPPIYVFWDPTGRKAAALLNDREAVTLGLLDPWEGGWSAIGSGLPFYFAWRDDGAELLAHVGGSVRENPGAEIRRFAIPEPPGEGAVGETVSDRPAGFRAPAWGGRARFAYSAFTDDTGGAALFVREPDGRSRSLGRVSSRSAFSWNVDGKSLAVAEAVVPTGALYAGVNLVRVSDGHREPWFAGPVGGFFWSPDGARLAIASPDFDTGEWRWLVRERKSGVTREVLRFLPSPESQMLFLHFDQYALSHRIWSPDSRYFVFAAYPSGAGREGPATPTTWIVDAVTGQARSVAEGRSAFWSPR